MGDIHIRINKRTLERSFFIIVILALAAALFLSGPPQIADDSDTVASLESRIDALTSENEQLAADLEAVERDLQLERDADAERDTATSGADEAADPAPVEEPADTLSGELSVAWDVKMAADDSLNRVILTMQNGLDEDVELTYDLHWEDFYEQKVRVYDVVTLESGDQFYEYLVQDGSGLTSNPPGSVDTLILEVTDSDGEVVKRLRKVVR